MNNDFVSAMWPHALRVSQATGLDPRLVVAQSALETGWGRAAPGNNFFGIKSHGRPGGQTFATHEIVNGQRQNIRDSFRAYGGMGESADDYAAFLQSNPRYRGLLAAQGLDAQIEALARSGYATDPNYGAKVRSIAGRIDPSRIEAQGIANDALRAVGRQPAQATISTRGGGMGLLMEPVRQEPRPQQQGQQEQPKRRGLRNPEMWEAIALAANQLRMRPDPNLAPMVEGNRDRRSQEQQRNETVAYLEQIGRPDLAEAFGRGMLDTGQLWAAMQPPEDPAPVSLAAGSQLVDPRTGQVVAENAANDPSAIREYEFYAQQEQQAGRQPVPFGEWDQARRASGATQVNVGPTGIDYGSPPANHAWARTPDGAVQIDERGAPVALPVGPALRDIEEAEDQRVRGQENFSMAAGTLIQDAGRALELLDADRRIPVAGAGSSIAAAVLPFVGNYDARTLRSHISSIQSNIGIDRIVAMREAGGTLGAIPFQQQVRMESLIGLLDADGDPAVLGENLKRIHNLYWDMVDPENRLGRTRFELPFDESGFSRGAEGDGRRGYPISGEVHDGYRFKGGDPANPDNWERVR